MSLWHDKDFIHNLVAELNKGEGKTFDDVSGIVIDRKLKPTQVIISYKDWSFITIFINRPRDLLQPEPSESSVH